MRKNWFIRNMQKYKLHDNESYMNEIHIKQLESVTEERSLPHYVIPVLFFVPAAFVVSSHFCTALKSII